MKSSAVSCKSVSEHSALVIHGNGECHTWYIGALMAGALGSSIFFTTFSALRKIFHQFLTLTLYWALKLWGMSLVTNNHVWWNFTYFLTGWPTLSRHCTSAGACGQGTHTHVMLNSPFLTCTNAKKASKSHLKQLAMKRMIFFKITAKCWRSITGIFSKLQDKYHHI